MAKAAKLVRAFGESGDPMALAVFAQQAQAVGRLFTIAANFTDPDAYFLGGGVVETAPHFRVCFLEKVRESTALKEEQAAVARFEVVPHLDMAGARGAAIAALERILAGNRLALEDMGAIEFMEAFAAVPATFRRRHPQAAERANGSGGHLAMGHPMGASGAILVATLLAEMERKDVEWGVAVAHAVSGVGAAVLLRRASPTSPYYSRAICGFEPWRLRANSQLALADFILLRHFRLGLAD